MRPVRTVAEIRAAEAAHGAELAAGDLMARASFALAMRCCTLLRAMRGRVVGARVLVLAGSGGNGGDALFAGAFLAARGCRVDVVTAVDRVHDAGLRAARRAGARVHAHHSHAHDSHAHDSHAHAAALIGEADLVLDGLVGIGATGGLRPPMDALAALTHAAEAVVVAVDVPSGVDADTGLVPGVAVRADVTVTFGALKPGLLTGAGRQHAGTCSVVDIGIDDAFADPRLAVLEAADVAALLPEPAGDAHKYRRGVVGLAVGSEAYPGAGELVAAAAASGLAGMVMSLRPTGIADVVPVASIAAANRVSAWVCGSGWPVVLGATEQAARAALVATEVPLVLDAGATAALGHDDGLRHAVRERPAPTIVTPHEGEFARMCDVLLDDRVAASRKAAAALGGIVVLKGPGTVVADPDGRVVIDDLGGPELAVAGSGDVLAGLLGAVLAAGVPAFEAAAVAVSLHSAAGRIAAQGGRPVTATGLATAIPEAVRWARRGAGPLPPTTMGR